MSVNFDNVHFQSFVDFAQRCVDANEAKAVISATVTKPLEGRAILTIDKSKTDEVHKWTRGEEEWNVNDRTRALFKQVVANMFGGESKIPESVKKAMLLVDYNKGKPLTARRILAVKAAIDPFAATFKAKLADAKQAAEYAYSKVNEGEELDPGEERVTKAQVDGLVETAMKAVGADKDALDILASHNVMNGLLVGGDNHLRSAAAVEQKVKAILANLSELRQAAGGVPGILAAGKSLLAQLLGKSLPAGLITSIIRESRSADVSALKRLSDSSSGRSIHKALNQATEAQVRIVEATDMEKKLAGADERSAVRDFINGLLLAKCGTSGIRKIRAALHSENARKLMSVYSMVEGGDFEKPGLSRAATSQTTMMGARAKRLLSQLQIAVDVSAGVPDDQIERIGEFDGDFNYAAFGASRILDDLAAAGRAEARRVHDVFLQTIVKGSSPGADALRAVYHNRIGAEAYEPKEDIASTSRENAAAMLNWAIAKECKKFALGQFSDTMFAKDLERMSGVVKFPDGQILSDDINTACDQIAAFVTKGARTTYNALTDTEKTKAHIVMTLLTQEMGKAAFDAQFTALDPKNIMPPVSASSGDAQANDTRELTLSLDEQGRLKVQFTSVQRPDFLLTDPGDGGRVVSTLVGKGSEIQTQLTFTLKPGEFDRLASLKYTEFDDAQAVEINASKNVKNRLPKAVQSFNPDFRFSDDGFNINIGLRSTIN